MVPPLRPCCWILGLVIICLTAAGCGPSLIKVNGKILKNGEPMKAGRGERLLVFFYRHVEGVVPGDVFPANRGAEPNSFQVPGKNGKGIPPGKYRIAIKLTDSSGDKDALKGEFSRDNSPIVRDVNSSEEMIIDLAKP